MSQADYFIRHQLMERCYHHQGAQRLELSEQILFVKADFAHHFPTQSKEEKLSSLNLPSLLKS